MIDGVGAGKPTRLLERELIGIVARDREARKPWGDRFGVLRQPRINIAGSIEQIERAPGIECFVDRPASVAGIGPAVADCPPCRRHRGRQAAEACGQYCLQPLSQRLGEPRRGPSRADRNEHRIAIDDRRQRKIAQIGSIDGVDQYLPRAQSRDARLGLRIILDRDDGERGLCLLADDHRPRPFEQAALRRRRLSIAHENNRPSRDLHEDRQRLHHSFSRHSR